MGGSNSDRISVCAGSVNMAAQYPAEPSGPAAIDGTHSHTLLEYCLNHNLVDAGLVVSKVMHDHEGEFEVTQERADRVNVALNYIWPKVRDGMMTLITEQFVDAGKQYGIPQWGGSVDVTLLSPDYEFVEIIDYKDGGKPVSPETNQLVTYGVGTLQELLERNLPVPKKIRCTIIQPRVYPEPRSVEYTYAEFMSRADALSMHMFEALKPDAARVEGVHCKYCPGAKAGRCPEFNEGAQVAINEAFKNVPVSPGGMAVAAPGGAQLQSLPMQLPEINENTPAETIAAIIDAKPLIMAIIKEAEEEGAKRAKSGTKIPGQKLVRATTHRRFVKNAEEELGKMRLKRSMYMEEKMLSPTKVVESKEFKALSDARRAKIEALIIKPEGGLVLVPESDPKAEVVTDVASIFADVPPAPVLQAPAAEDEPLSFL